MYQLEDKGWIKVDDVDAFLQLCSSGSRLAIFDGKICWVTKSLHSGFNINNIYQDNYRTSENWATVSSLYVSFPPTDAFETVNAGRFISNYEYKKITHYFLLPDVPALAEYRSGVLDNLNHSSDCPGECPCKANDYVSDIIGYDTSKVSYELSESNSIRTDSVDKIMQEISDMQELKVGP